MADAPAVSVGDDTVSYEEAVERAAALPPNLAKRAEEVEKTRKIHPDTVKDLW